MAKDNKEQQQILQTYAAFMASIILSLLPFMSAALLSLGLAIVVLVMAYIYRGKAEDKSLLENHMIFIIRTIWVGAFIALICMVIGAGYLFVNLNNMPLLDCQEAFLAMGDQIFHPDIFKTVFAPCQEAYFNLNLETLIIGGGIVVLPPLIYFSVRIVRGLARASKGYRIAEPGAWF